jgi:hypothetical protein
VTHRLIVEARARRNGKTTQAMALARRHASAGEHVHYGLEICWNGGPECLAHVKEQIQCTGGCSTALMGDYGSGGK